MDKPKSPTPLADVVLGHVGRSTSTLFLHDSERGTLSNSLDHRGAPIPGSGPQELRAGLHREAPKPRPKPEPEPESESAPEPPPAALDPADQELADLRARQVELADIRRTIDKQGRDLEWLTRFGSKAPF